MIGNALCRETDRGNYVATLLRFDVGLHAEEPMICAKCGHRWEKHSCGLYGPCREGECKCRAYINHSLMPCIQACNELLAQTEVRNESS